MHWTALTWAALRNRAGCCRWLLDRGALVADNDLIAARPPCFARPSGAGGVLHRQRPELQGATGLLRPCAGGARQERAARVELTLGPPAPQEGLAPLRPHWRALPGRAFPKRLRLGLSETASPVPRALCGLGAPGTLRPSGRGSMWCAGAGALRAVHGGELGHGGLERVPGAHRHGAQATCAGNPCSFTGFVGEITWKDY